MSIQNTKDDSFEEKIPDEDTFAEIGDDSSSSSNRLTKLTRKPINLDKQIEKVPLVLSIWAPILALSLFTFVGVIQINEK